MYPGVAHGAVTTVLVHTITAVTILPGRCTNHQGSLSCLIASIHAWMSQPWLADERAGKMCQYTICITSTQLQPGVSHARVLQPDSKGVSDMQLPLCADIRGRTAIALG